MSKLNSYCIFDTAAAFYQRPFFCGADGEATRLFVDLVGDKTSPPGKHPEDYCVFRIGSFNDLTGVIVGDQVRECLITGMDVIAMERSIEREESK